MADHQYVRCVWRNRNSKSRKWCYDSHDRVQYCQLCQTLCEDDGCHRTLYVYCDGACANNGTNYAQAGIGVWFGYDSEHNISTPLPYYENPQTSQRAELYAACEAIEAAFNYRDYEENEYNARTSRYAPAYHRCITIMTDSAYVFNGFHNWIEKWTRNGYINSRGTRVVNADLFQRLYDLKYSEEYDHECLNVVKIDREENEEADELARDGCHQ
ncbi:Ribonuclease H1 [Tulasnella sp. 418]|nr:Ribonuclease H1 [Tulasnella sp. 418]